MAGRKDQSSTQSDADSARYARIRTSATARRAAMLGRTDNGGQEERGSLTDQERYRLILGVPLQADTEDTED